jgi:hypothetical protein
MTGKTAMIVWVVFPVEARVSMMNCIYCENEAIVYCDFTMALEPKHALRKDGKITLLAGINSKVFTCDAPLCRKHAVAVGHVCGENADSIDYCQYHFYDQGEYEVLFEDEVEEKRRYLHAEIRRSTMKTVEC